MSGEPQGTARWQRGGDVGKKTGATQLRWGAEATGQKHREKQLRLRQRWNTHTHNPLFPGSLGFPQSLRLRLERHSGVWPASKRAARSFVSTRSPTRGLLPRGAAHPPARSLPRLQGARSAASSPTPAAPRPRLHPGPGDLCVSGGLSASSPPGAPRGQQPPQEASIGCELSAAAHGAPPPRSPNQLRTPAAHAARGHATDKIPTRAARWQASRSLPSPAANSPASAGTAGSGPAGAQSERADAGPVVADAPRRLRLRPPPTPQPRAFRSARAAGRLTRGRAPRSTWLPGRGASRTAQYSRPPSRGGARRRGAGCRTAGRWVDRSRRSRSSECALLSLARRLRLDASACSPERARAGVRKKKRKEKRKKKKKRLLLKRSNQRRRRKATGCGSFPTPACTARLGQRDPCRRWRRRRHAGRSLAWGWGLWLGRGLGGAGGYSQETSSVASNAAGEQGRPCPWTERWTVSDHRDWWGTDRHKSAPHCPLATIKLCLKYSRRYCTQDACLSTVLQMTHKEIPRSIAAIFFCSVTGYAWPVQ
jgi:hypothetical protein